MEAHPTRRALSLVLVPLLAIASLAAALGQPDPAEDPLQGRTLGELTYKAMTDRAFAERVEHHLREHGIGHPQRLVDAQTLGPLARATRIVTDESIQGRTPQAWIGLSHPDALLALQPAAPAEADLADAVARINAAAGLRLTARERADVAAQAAALPEDVRAPLARLAARVADVYEAQVPIARDVVAQAHAADAPIEMIVSGAQREAMLAHGLALVAASNAFRDEVADVEFPASTTPLFRDPNGLVIVGSIGNDVHPRTGALKDPVLSVDPAGADTYLHAAGAACPDLLNLAHTCNGLSAALALDLGGADQYLFTGLSEPAIAHGAGSIGGVGVLVDATGDDAYTAKMTRTHDAPFFNYIDGGMQGFGQAGVGILLDASGSDTYTADVQSLVRGYGIWNFAQGYGGVGGFGLIADATGDDRYYSRGLTSVMDWGDFQGVYTNGVSIYAGVGVAVDAGRGNDQYYSWDAATSTDYYAVGFGAFGGLGIIFEDGGDDDYTAGEEIWNNPSGSGIIVPLLNCAFGTGSLGGTGIMLEMGGDDTYFGTSISPRAAYTMNEGFGGPGTAAGVFVDVSGDDGHFMEAHGAPGSNTYGRGVFIASLGHVLLDVGGNMLGAYLDAGGADQYTGASPSRDNGQWVAGADVNLVPTGILLG